MLSKQPNRTWLMTAVIYSNNTSQKYIKHLTDVFFIGYRFDIIHSVQVLTINNPPTNARNKIQFMYKY